MRPAAREFQPKVLDTNMEIAESEPAIKTVWMKQPQREMSIRTSPSKVMIGQSGHVPDVLVFETVMLCRWKTFAAVAHSFSSP
jgi:hypothetical protein